MKKQTSSILLGSVIGLMSANAAVAPADYALTVKNAVASDHAKVTEIVSESLAGHPDLACEIVSGAIEGAKANAKTVAIIVESAVVALPDQASLVTKCALAAAPDATAEVYAALAAMGVNSGEDSKGATIAPSLSKSNVLDFPVGQDATEGVSNVVGAAPGMASGSAGGGGAGSIVVNAGGGSGGSGATGGGGGGASNGGGGGGGIVIIPPVTNPQPNPL